MNVDLKEAAKTMKGFERIEFIEGSTFKDNSTAVIIPLRTQSIHYKVAQAIAALYGPMNTKRQLFFVTGHEVGHAYNEAVKAILNHPEMKNWKYILTVEDDNLPPQDAHLRLIESIEAGPFDAVSGIYFTKGEWNMPMAYGDAIEFARTGVLDFRPIDIVKAMKVGNIVEVNGIGMGCALWRMELFRNIPQPWFVTACENVPEKGTVMYTQDLYFCERAKRSGKRFAVDLRVHVGHIDKDTGVVY
jgi:hypothetical protein